jgi:hypothetical protein
MIDWLARSIRPLIPVVGVLAIAFTGNAQAAAPAVDLTIAPAHPYVDDNVRVSFTDTRSLPADSEIDVVLVGTGVCSSTLAAKTIKGPRGAGRRFNLRFRPSDQIVGSGVEWCQGKAKVRVTEAKNESFVRKLAQATIRFRAKP